MTSPSAGEIRRTLGPLVRREGGAPDDWAETLASFLSLLLERNAAVNLVSRRTADEVLVRQVLPSLGVLRLVPSGRGCRFLDVGSGGGFPGIPLRILRPEVRLDLVEATGNKSRFLEECVARLGWDDAMVHGCRIEAPAGTLRQRAPFDLAVARAVGREKRLARAVAPLLADGAAAWIFVPLGEGDVEWAGPDGEPVTALRRLAVPGRSAPSSG